MRSDYIQWSEVPYGIEKRPPKDPVDPQAKDWPMYYLTRKGDQFYGPNGDKVHFTIRHPQTINWYRQLRVVQQTLNRLTPNELTAAKYWGAGAATKQWTPIVDRLIDTYSLTPTRAARVLAAVHEGINDTFVVVWYYKFLWNVARPIQYDRTLKPVISTPRFPTYISGHAAVAGYVQTILSYFFPGEAKRLKELAEENAMSRLYGGVHFPIDNEEGLSLGKQIGAIITNELKQQQTDDGSPVDISYGKNLHADLQPPPYIQAIPYDFDQNKSETDHSCKHPHINIPKPRLFF